MNLYRVLINIINGRGDAHYNTTLVSDIEPPTWGLKLCRADELFNRYPLSLRFTRGDFL
jgi:hypothetical protein